MSPPLSELEAPVVEGTVDPDAPAVKSPMRMREKLVLRVVSSAFIPFIVLFALYVQFHGDYGPGGGFQAGVILAAGVILHGLNFGLASVQRVLPPIALEIGSALGLLLYIGTGFYCMVAGYGFLEYEALGHGYHGQHYGILLVEGGVGIAVTCVMLAIYYAVAGRGRF